MKNNLEKAAREYSVENPIEHEVQDIDESYYLQKPKQDFIAGVNWQKEQMLKDTVDADTVFDYYDNQNRLYVSILATDVLAKKYSLKDGDKVKIIIVKEEEI